MSSGGTSKITKKFVNVPDAAVNESIWGLAASNELLSLHENCSRVVLRVEKDEEKKQKVALVAGGGSGHEPFAAGFVGRGFLSAAICGNVFASPPTAHITAALEAVRNERGTVVFVINYTGDRLNFGIAVERFNAKYTRSGAAWMNVIGDDVALESRPEVKGVGRRGLAGALLVLKICGAMAEEGADADKIAVTAQNVNDNVGTIGVSLYACSMPGKGPMFELPEKDMEIGLGIHGEPGCERAPFRSAKDTVDMMLQKLEKSDKRCLVKGSKTAILLNNLGGTSQIEMNILSGEIASWLCNRGYTMARLYSGTLMTSLDGHGFSITALNVANDAWLQYLDASTDAPGWKVSSTIPNLLFASGRAHGTEPSKFKLELAGPTLSAEGTNRFHRSVRNACGSVIAAEEKLNLLDGQSGDGDCGSTLSGGAKHILAALDRQELHCDRPQTAFQQISQIFEDDVGGTTGALYALMFSAGSAAFADSAGPSSWHTALCKGLDAIMKYGRAKPGFRSMVDPLFAAANSINGKEIAKEQWEAMIVAAEAATEATVHMRALCGRASYTAEATQTEPDPGATAVAIWMRALYEAAFADH